MDRIDHDSVVNAEVEEGTKKSRRLPELWTRVISISTDNLTDLKLYPISTDLLIE